MADLAPAPVTFAQVLRNRQFFLLWLAQFISSFGDWLAILALFSLIAFRWRGSPGELAGLFISFILPWAIFGPIAGVYVDRWRLKRTMIGSDLIRAALVLLFAFAQTPWQLYVLLGATSFVSCFFLPAQNAAIPVLVRKEELLVANAINAQTVHFTKIVSPALAGVLVAWAGERLCFYLDSVSFVLSALLLAGVTMPHRGPSAAKGVAAVFRELREGLRHLHAQRALRLATLAMAMALFIIGAFDALIAIYVRDILGMESKAFGTMISAIGVGTIAGAAALAKFAQRAPRLYLVMWGLFGCGVGVLLLALAANAAAAIALSATLGLSVSAVLVPSQTLIQEETPQEMLGRVSSTAFSLMTVAQLVGVAIAGRLAAWLGIRPLYVLLAVALAVIGSIGFLYARNLKTAPTSGCEQRPA
jgi:MFS family permease